MTVKKFIEMPFIAAYEKNGLAIFITTSPNGLGVLALSVSDLFHSRIRRFMSALAVLYAAVFYDGVMQFC